VFDLDMDKLEQKLNQIDTTRNFGHINRVIGLVIESIGPHASIGEICLIRRRLSGSGGRRLTSTAVPKF